jgi:hypothetical protein
MRRLATPPSPFFMMILGIGVGILGFGMDTVRDNGFFFSSD